MVPLDAEAEELTAIYKQRWAAAGLEHQFGGAPYSESIVAGLERQVADVASLQSPRQEVAAQHHADMQAQVDQMKLEMMATFKEIFESLKPVRRV